MAVAAESEPLAIFRFGAFEADFRSNELRKSGIKVRIQDLPFRALKLFLGRPSRILSRDELREALWPDNVHVDFERGISSTINRLRETLDDTASSPRYIETVPRIGYRWIAPVEALTTASPVIPSISSGPAAGVNSELLLAQNGRSWKMLWAMVAMVAMLPLVIGAIIWKHTGLTPPSQRQRSPQFATLSAKYVPNPEAEELYLQGRYHWDKRTPEDLHQAVDYFNQAIARDPNYAAAYVGLANCYSLLREFAAMPSEEAFAHAEAAARKAIELDDSSAEAHTALAFVTFYWNWNAMDAEREFRRALELDPNYVTAHHWYATFLMMLGRLPEALEQIERARQLDPASTAILADKALILFHQGERGQAIALLKQLSASQPAFFSTHRYLSLVYMDKGEYGAYLEEAGKAAELSGDAQEMAIVQQAREGYRSGGASGMFQSMVLAQKQYFEAEKMPAFSVATTYARMGQKNEALRYLQTSFRRHEVAFLAIRVHEAFVDLHHDPAFQQLVGQAGLPPLS